MPPATEAAIEEPNNSVRLHNYFLRFIAVESKYRQPWHPLVTTSYPLDLPSTIATITATMPGDLKGISGCAV
jgi:hypothetical protein